MVAKKNKLLTHMRDVTNWLNEYEAANGEIKNIDNMDAIVEAFTSAFTTSPVSNLISPEMFQFFLQKINHRILFNTMDSKNYSIVYPEFIPFDVDVMASKYGYKDLSKTVQKAFDDRKRNAGNLKTASAAILALGGEKYLDKVAGYSEENSDKFAAMRAQVNATTLRQEKELLNELRNIYWQHSNLENLTKTAAFNDPRYINIFEKEIKGSPISGGMDKTAGLGVFTKFCNILDKLIAVRESMK